MNIERPFYLQQLIESQGNHLIKVITGMKRSGKTYLLMHLFHEYLLSSGVDETHIIQIALDDRRNVRLC